MGPGILLLLALCVTSAENARRSHSRAQSLCDAQEKLASKVNEMREEQDLLLSGQQYLRDELQLLREELKRSQEYIRASIPEDCSDAVKRGVRKSGPVMIAPPGLAPRLVRCEHGGDWTVILLRENCGFRENFNRTWEEYAHGFGDVNLEYWIGNDALHSLTKSRPHQLMVEMEDSKGVYHWARWRHFRVEGPEQRYKLRVRDKEAGNATDPLKYHDDRYFSTYDRLPDTKNTCAQDYGGGWWFHMCFRTFPTGVGFHPGTPHERAFHWDYNISNLTLKSLAMMIRPVPDKMC